jgi:hypothetical protein
MANFRNKQSPLSGIFKQKIPNDTPFDSPMNALQIDVFRIILGDSTTEIQTVEVAQSAK